MFGGAPKYKKGEDDSETVIISSQALCKMLKHGKAGIPLEVMGLLMGEFIDKYTVYVSDVFAMPQSGSGNSVESVDDVFQADMLLLRKQVGYAENVVGWYHTHPGFGPWLSGIDQKTQEMFENLDPRSIAIVIDPIQSVRGKVMLESFRLMNMINNQPSNSRITTSNRGFLRPKEPLAILHQLDSQFYQMPISFVKLENETTMLKNIEYVSWNSSITPDIKKTLNMVRDMRRMRKLAKNYLTDVEEQVTKEEEKKKVAQMKKERQLNKELTTIKLETEKSKSIPEVTSEENENKPTEETKENNNNINDKLSENKSKEKESIQKALKSIKEEEFNIDEDSEDEDFDVLRHVGRENPRKHAEDLANAMLKNANEIEMYITASSVAFTQAN